MLKVSITIESNIRAKQSNAHVFKKYLRIYYSNYFYFFFLKKSESGVASLLLHDQSKFRNNKMTLIRSPFHYKISKTLISQPKQQFKIEFGVHANTTSPLFLKNDFSNFIKTINGKNNYVIKNVKISH